MMGSSLKRWRKFLSRIISVIVIAVLGYWIWQNHTVIIKIFTEIQTVTLIEVFLLITLSIFFQTVSFTLLIRGMGYPFGYTDSYHSLNLSQIAAMVPGKIWGFAGLAGLLWSRGISKSDSIMIISLQTLLMLSAAVFVGTFGLIPAVGWHYTLITLVPVSFLLLRHSWSDYLRCRFFPNSSPLPSPFILLITLGVGIISWITVSAGFFLIVFSAEGKSSAFPLIIISSFSAGYVAGFISLITPSGLGVREGVIALILEPFIGREKALGLAIVFRIIHMTVLYLNIFITLLILSFEKEDKES